MNQKQLIEEISNIRSLMEKSSKFMSISGLSGVLIGSYAIIGAFWGYTTVYGFESGFEYRDYYISDKGIILKLTLIASLVLLASILTGYLMARRKAKRIGQSVWNPTSKSLATAMLVPLLTGGILAIILVVKEQYNLIATIMLIFYGLSLYAAGTFTFKELRWLGILDIILGLVALCLPGYGLWFWVLGFGILHIIYGLIVHQRYEK